ncbi:unnamed protein product, partial [Allacma fusca]
SVIFVWDSFRRLGEASCAPMGTRVLGNGAGSEISEFFKDQSVWITGGAGFVGKALIEKLLRTCPGVKAVYVLIRPKRTWDVKTRMENMLNGSVSSFLTPD